MKLGLLLNCLIKLLLILKVCVITINCNECPPIEWLHPCECEELSVTCGGSQNYNISQIFENIAKNWKHENKHFDCFILQNNQIEGLIENLFHGITFTKLFIINAVNLKRITSQAFVGTKEFVEEFHQIGKSNLGETDESLRQLFDALSSLPNLKWIHFEGITIKSIPAHAFSNKNQDKLSFIDFIPLSISDPYGLIRTVGDYAFYNLKSLKYIELSHQKIDHISKNAFDFSKPSNNSLIINLSDNYLNELSFATGAFINAKRPLFIHLYNNQIQYLNESIFLPLLKLDKRNKINIGGFNPFDCDCRSQWLLRDKNHLINQIEGIQCRDGKSFWDKTDDDFENCHH